VEPRGVEPPTSRARSGFRVSRASPGARNYPGKVTRLQAQDPFGPAAAHERADAGA